MSSVARFPCLRCGVPLHLVGCCMDCRAIDPAMCRDLTAEARRYRTPNGIPHAIRRASPRTA